MSADNRDRSGFGPVWENPEQIALEMGVEVERYE